MDCIDLRKHFGKTYRITWDEAYDHKGVPHRCRDPWYAQIPCKFGTVYPHAGTALAAQVDYHPRVAKLLAAVPSVRLWQHGDHEKTFIFDIQAWDQVAAILLPRRPKVLSPEHRLKLVEAGKKALASVSTQREVKSA